MAAGPRVLDTARRLRASRSGACPVSTRSIRLSGYPYYGYPFYGAGFGYGYYGYYDPWWYGGYAGYGYYGGGYSGGYGEGGEYTTEAATGSIRLRASPSTAKVYVDGTLMGIVDDFDGLSNHLDLSAGQHTLELRADGYETYEGTINVLIGKTMTERVTLKKK